MFSKDLAGCICHSGVEIVCHSFASSSAKLSGANIPPIIALNSSVMLGSLFWGSSVSESSSAKVENSSLSCHGCFQHLHQGSSVFVPCLCLTGICFGLCCNQSGYGVVLVH